jgi:ABC-2 type transport system ATP-binding protein
MKFLSADDLAVSVEGLSHTYDGKKYVVNDVSFDVKRGEIFGLLGQNGAGKTTTIKILTTLLQATKGNVKVLGYDPRSEGNKIRKRIGVVQQDNSFEFASVKDNFDLYGFLWGVPKKIRDQRRNELIEMFSLQDLVKQTAFDLSGGQQRRVQVAREFIHDMDLLFLDEPTIGLDPLMRRKILDMLKEKVRKENLTIFFTTHNLEEADYLCDRIAIMNLGVFQAVDTADNLKRKYGETKAIELSLAPANGVRPSYEQFFKRLTEIHRDIEIKRQATETEPAIIVSKNPEQVLQSVISVASEQHAVLDWLNVRKSTLEDVFIQTVSADQSNGKK